MLRCTIQSTIAGPSADSAEQCVGPTATLDRMSRPSGWPLLASWRSIGHPGGTGLDHEHGDPGPARSGPGTSTASANVPEGTHALTPVEGPTVAGRLGHGRRVGRACRQLNQRGRERRCHRPRRRAATRCCWAVGPELGDGRCRPRPESPPPARRRRCAPAASASRPVSRKPSPAPPTSSGRRDAQQARRGQLGPELAVEAVAVDVALQLPQALLGRQVGEDPVGQVADGLLLLAE